MLANKTFLGLYQLLCFRCSLPCVPAAVCGGFTARTLQVPGSPFMCGWGLSHIALVDLKKLLLLQS